MAIVASSASAGAAAGAIVGDGVGAVVGAAGGAIIGTLLAWMNHDKGDTALIGAKAAYANALANLTSDYLGIAKAEIDNLNTLWNASQYYLVRKAEWAAQDLYDYQIANGISTVYDPFYVLSRSEVANATTSYAWAMASQIEAIINSHLDLAASFVGTYDGMSWGLCSSTYKNDNNWCRSTALERTYRVVEVLTMGRTLPGQYITVSAGAPIYLYNSNEASDTFAVTITNRNGTVAVSESVTLAKGEYKVYNLAELGFLSGDYTFSKDSSTISSDHSRWFGDFSTSISSSGGVYPSILSFYKDGTSALIDLALINYGDGGGCRVLNAEKHAGWTTGVDPPNVYFDTDSTIDSEVALVPLWDLMESIESIINKTAGMQSTANAFAQTYYNYMVANGPEAPRITPDVIFPDPSQLVGMSWQQIYAIFLAYMTQMNDWFDENSVMGQENVNISAESLDLLCRGAIYNASGGIVYNDTTVWTPYISLEDMTLTAGQNNTMTQPGFVIVWGYADDIANFSQPSTCAYVPVTVGWNLSIEEMTLKGAQVTETTLTVTEIKWVVYEPGGNITMPQGLNDLDWIIDHWYYLAIIGGVICLLGAIATRNMPILATGLVLMSAGAIGWYLAGDTSLLSWFSMEPTNLRAWLQQLR